MHLLNLTHPLTEEQRAEIETLAEQPITTLIEQMAQFDVAQPFGPQISAQVDDLGLSPAQWQTEAIMLMLPALNFGAATLLAELHGRCGYFPPIVRTRPVQGSLPPRFEVAEIINLQALRDTARAKR